MRKLLISALLFFLVVNIFLLWQFWNRLQRNKTPETLPITTTKLYLENGEVIEHPSDYQNKAIAEYLISAEVRDSAYISQDKKYFIPLLFKTAKNKEVEVDALLGSPNKKIQLASGLRKIREIEGPISWYLKEIEEAQKLLAKGKIITIRIPSEAFVLDKLGLKPEECRGFCQENLEDINRFYKNNINLVRMIREEINPVNDLNIGPVRAVAIFD